MVIVFFMSTLMMTILICTYSQEAVDLQPPQENYVRKQCDSTMIPLGWKPLTPAWLSLVSTDQSGFVTVAWVLCVKLGNPNEGCLS